MRAWRARKEGRFWATVVFAETRGKARAIARYTDACEDCDFCDIEVHRLPQADKYYKDGKMEMDWYNPQDRIALVKDCGFVCETVELDICEDCPAKQYCDDYEDEKEWELQNG